MDKTVEIVTKRFLLRDLIEEDVTERYLRWLGDADAKRFIAAATKTKSLSDLKQYVLNRIGRDDILFLGIFEKTTGLHIGNIKYEPVNSELGYAIMGILLGDPIYRGKGVTAEVLMDSAQWLKYHRKIKQILLGVSKDNPAAMRAYKKVGFVVADTPFIQKSTSGAITMVWIL
jgi:RimJ/RimL family protein N-acetyltransferase